MMEAPLSIRKIGAEKMKSLEETPASYQWVAQMGRAPVSIPINKPLTSLTLFRIVRNF
jgi:hypothetical protein